MVKETRYLYCLSQPVCYNARFLFCKLLIQNCHQYHSMIFIRISSSPNSVYHRHSVFFSSTWNRQSFTIDYKDTLLAKIIVIFRHLCEDDYLLFIKYILEWLRFDLYSWVTTHLNWLENWWNCWWLCKYAKTSISDKQCYGILILTMGV